MLPAIEACEGAAARSRLGRNLAFGMLDNLGRRIVAGAYGKTGFTTEGELARDYGVSRAVTREAVKMLAAKGLLDARPRQGVAIQPARSWNMLDPDVLHWLLGQDSPHKVLLQFGQLRLAVEPEAAFLGARYATDDSLDRISRVLVRMEAAATIHDLIEAKIAFHAAVLRASGNALFAQFEDLVMDAQRSSARLMTDLTEAVKSTSLHRAVCGAIRAGDPQAARAGMRDVVQEELAALASADTR